jgi:lipoprotein NlpD
VRWHWPAVGKVTKHFSDKENGYKGLQITNVEGTPVKAAADGVVVYAGSALRGYGNLIILKHNDDYLSAYAHNSKLQVTEQQKVKVGQKIAEIGSTDATKTALRFEIRFRGQAVNPVKYLPSK